MSRFSSHLSFVERVHIEVLMRYGVTASGIARPLGRHRSTILRELRRAGSFGFRTYAADFGHRFYAQARRRAGRARRKLALTCLSSPTKICVASIAS